MQPITPAPTQTNAQGVAQLAPVAAPTPTQLPLAPPVGATPAPVATPNFNTAGALQDIANYYNIPRQTAQITGAGQAQGNVAQQGYDRDVAQKQLQASNLQDQLDPSKYKITTNPNDGGITITNSLGQDVSLQSYVNLTGANPAQVLQNSNNPKDQQFVSAYNNLQNYIQTKIGAQNGSQQAQAELNDYYEANPGLKNLELGQVSNAFMQQYGSFFGQPTQNGNALSQEGISPTIQSAANPVTTSAYENPTFQTEFTANPYQQSGSDISSLLSSLQVQNTGQ